MTKSPNAPNGARENGLGVTRHAPLFIRYTHRQIAPSETLILQPLSFMIKNMEAFALSKQLRQRRSELGLSLSEVARRVGTSAATLCRYEKGWERFGLNTLRKLAVALDCEVSVNLTPRAKPAAKPRPTRAVRQLRRLFWDRRLQEKDLTAHPVWVVERVLEYGQMEDVHLLMQFLGHEQFMECVGQARFGCPRTARLWQSVLAQEGRPCTRKFSRNTDWNC